MLTQHSVSTMLLCSWASTNLQSEPEVRTVLFASGTILAYLLNAFVPLAAYPTSQAPNWHIGAKLYLGFASAAAVLFVTIHFVFRYERKKLAGKEAARATEEDIEGNERSQHRLVSSFVPEWKTSPAARLYRKYQGRKGANS